MTNPSPPPTLEAIRCGGVYSRRADPKRPIKEDVLVTSISGEGEGATVGYTSVTAGFMRSAARDFRIEFEPKASPVAVKK